MPLNWSIRIDKARLTKMGSPRSRRRPPSVAALHITEGHQALAVGVGDLGCLLSSRALGVFRLELIHRLIEGACARRVGRGEVLLLARIAYHLEELLGREAARIALVGAKPFIDLPRFIELSDGAEHVALVVFFGENGLAAMI